MPFEAAIDTFSGHPCNAFTAAAPHSPDHVGLAEFEGSLRGGERRGENR